jgi:phosphatidylinositol alpha-1,6-mannosyltransferase
VRIALITYEFYPFKGGVAHTTASICKSFRLKKHELFIFNPFYSDTHIYQFPLKAGSTLTLFKYFKGKKILIFLIKSIWKILKDKTIPFSHRINIILYLFLTPKQTLRNYYNLIHMFPIIKSLNVDIIFGASVGACLGLIFPLSRLLDKKIVALAHGNDFLISRVFSMKSFYIKNIDKIIVSNFFMLKLIKRIHQLKKEKLAIINRGLLLEEYLVNESKEELRKTLKIPQERFVILSVGRHIDKKNFNLVIKALKQIKLKSASLDIKYYLIGTGPSTNKLKDLANQLNIQEDVIFLGECASNERNKYYKLSDLFIMPSITQKGDIEGFGIVFLEANYFKIPVIGTISGGIKEAIIDGETGFLIYPNDLEALVEKILFFYNNRELQIKMGSKGYNRVLKEFNWTYIIDQYIEIFEKVLRGN